MKIGGQAMHKLAFIPGNSLIHSLYPITKLFWLIFASIILFIISSGYLLMGMAAIFLLLLFSIHPQIWKVRGFRFVLTTGLVLFFLYLLFVKDGQTILNADLEIFKITSNGIEAGLLYCGRFYAIVFMSYLFILTTNPSQLAYALMRLGLTYRYGFMLVTTLRLAPILEEEGRTIYRAQLVRGIRYDQGNLKKILLLVRQFLTPLLISSLRRADRLYFSMEGRGFGRYKKRTFREHSQPTKNDLFVSLGLIIFITGLIVIDLGGFI